MLRPPSLRLLLVAPVVWLAACGSNATTPPPPVDGGGETTPYVCDVTAPTSCPDPPPHYPDVQPIFQRRCVTCHYGVPNGPWPLLQYQHVADWYDVIQGMVLDCSMPPPDLTVGMPNAERVAILTWILCGFPE